MIKDYSVTVNVPANLTGYADVYLVALWHLSQINPAPFGDHEACMFAEKVGREIIRRFIAEVGPELWNHQGAHLNSSWKKEGGAA